MSFLYPRTITITRPNTTDGVGGLSYQGLNPTTETIIASNILANIQKAENLRASEANLPGDVARGSLWAIFFKLPNGTVQNHDIVTDELGVRYQVTSSYWNSLGYKAFCERLQI